jgi:hypothetical protein
MTKHFPAKKWTKLYFKDVKPEDFARDFLVSWQNYCVEFGPGSEWIGEVEAFQTSEYEYEYSYITMSIDGDMKKYVWYVTDYLKSLDLTKYGILPMVGQITTSSYDDTDIDTVELRISFCAI